ncbi:MAG: hypothetical protein P8N09_05235 [Planctomycetota bacterium]|jgi:hypothetical protein|nr:hypothetical protein [Planctomycetota bacterium]
MDRTVATQIAALVVVLAILVRWIPGEDPFRDPLGRGAPLEVLKLDSYLKELQARDPLAPTAYLRGFGKKDPDRWKAYFVRRMRDAARIQESYRDDPSVFVQFKGVPRNEMWPLMYDLYPVPMVGTWAENGSTRDDPTEPGATVVESRLERPVDEVSAPEAAGVQEPELTLEQRKELRRLQRQAERRKAASGDGR